MKKQALNPFLPSYEYIPDAEPYVYQDRVYIYGSHDCFNGDTFCINDYVSWSAPIDDLGNWRYEGVIYRKTQDPRYQPGNNMYAPDIAVGPDGRYYLYYTLDMTGTMAVAVADSPIGPFQYYGRVRYPDGRILGDGPEDVYQFDPGILVDNGKVWLYTGFGPRGPKEIIAQYFGKHRIDGAFCIELEQDMLTIKEDPVCIIPQFENATGTEFEEHPFFEASSIRKIRDQYYFVYSSTWGHELCYAVSEHPNQGFRFGGTIVSNGNVGLKSWTMDRAANYMGNNHGGMVNIRGQWYIFYHRQTNYHGFSRQACAEKITIEEDGRISQVEMTSCGLNHGDLKGSGRYYAAHACQLYAAEGASFIDRAAAQRHLHPGFTQDTSDHQQEENQYITNLRQGSVVGFQYFDLCETTAICVEVRGSTGKMYVRDTPGGTLLAEVSVHCSNSFSAYDAALTNGHGHSGLFFEIETEGSIDFRAFTLTDLGNRKEEEAE